MKSRGYTLIELLVVIAIIGVLATFAVIAMNSARTKARETQALSDVDAITSAIMMMAEDTGKWPNGCPVEAVTNPEANINLEGAGLTERPLAHDYGDGCIWTENDVAKWNGPYVRDVIDPWGNPYWFDPDYYPRQGCGATNVQEQVVVLSYGPNGRGLNEYDCDDVYKVMR